MGLLAASVCALLLLASAIAPGAQAAVGEFQPLASSSVPLTSVTIDPSTQLIYAQENRGTDYFRYDPRTDAWTEIAEAPINSGNNGGAAYLNGKIYTSYTNNSAELGVYDIATDTWSTIPNPLGDGTADITAFAGELYLVNGLAFVKYDPATETTTKLADAPEFNPGGCNLGFEPWGGLQPYQGKIYGHQGDGCRGFAVYDVASDSWTELAETPEGHEGEGAVAGSALDPVTGTYYTYGDYDGEEFFSYDIAAGTWATSKLPFEVEDGGLAYVSLPGNLRGIYAIQGEGGEAFTRFTTREPEPEPVTPTPTTSTTPAVTAVAPVVTKAAPVVTNAAPLQCLSTRSENVHWQTRRGVKLKGTTITLNGKAYRTLSGQARQATISLKGLSGKVTLKIVGAATNGKRYVNTRAYQLCATQSVHVPATTLFLNRS